ncbi:MAG: hypothetical protein IJB00_07330 [Akkermansia sp.]|nr:hypothetical protein [Akkermansia sp.]
MTTLYIFTSLIIVFVISSLWLATYLFRRAKDLAPYYAEKETLEQDIATAKQSRAQMLLELDRLAADHAQAKQDISDAECQRKWLQDNQGTVASLKGQIASTQRELEDATDKLDKIKTELQDKNAELKDILEKLNSSNWLLQSAQNQLTEAKSEHHRLTDENTKRQAELQKLIKEVSQSELDLASIKHKVSDEGERLKSLNNKKQELENELAQLRARNEEEKRGLKKEIDDLKAEIAALTKERNTVKSKVSELTYELSSHVSRDQMTLKKWEDLDRPIKTINITTTTKYDEQNWLSEFEDNLATTGFRFDTRLIKAFHTSLKVADCSPMVVLSGISGTGKSLLPELYAHAVGMNFLQVPVQPRWDSPQDMLGFYNYMEHRYKATELSRLLWQSDRFNNPAQAKNNPAMNLILLDEMNLARVEYYFSDMLSKLEVRRGIDPTNEAKRRAAEIVLESGATSESKDVRRIFVGSNNLFIGTMNEDESTQSLSDKVKDRANVLRFGRPKELSGAAANKEAFFKKYTNRMMSETMWKKWISTSGDGGISNLGQQMDEINSYLAELGRPFAHRMWNTVAAYIRQYPGDKHDALIDQIEMKILPKLAGLDMADPTINRVMNHLADYLHKLEEPKLNDAFDVACKRDFFAWQGIER